MSDRAALEQAILEDPTALAPREVYADWLQREGDIAGEWAALQAAIRARPDEIALRVASFELLKVHGTELLGRAAKRFDRVHLGWYGGLLDEIRIFGTSVDLALEELFELPIGRFVRTIALGDVEVKPDEALRAIAGAKLPLLDTFVFDAVSRTSLNTTRDITKLFAAVPRLRRLGVDNSTASKIPWKKLPRTVEQLAIWGRFDAAGAKLRSVEELVWIEPRATPAELPALPSLRRLRLISVAQDLAGLLDAFIEVGAFDRLELLDLRGSDLTGTRAQFARLGEGCRILKSSGVYSSILEGDVDDVPWLRRRLDEAGRDALAFVPHAGAGLYNASCNALERGELDAGLELASAAVTLPDPIFGEWGWGNLGYARQRLRDHREGELAAREGLLRFGANANFYSILLASLRGQRRLRDAHALVPAATASLKPETRETEAQVCLLDIIITLDFSGEAKRAVDVASKYARTIPFDDRLHAALALAQLSLGQVAAAKRSGAAIARSAVDEFGVIWHARAALAVAANQLDKARAAIAEARKIDYADAWFFDQDPRLAAIAGETRPGGSRRAPGKPATPRPPRTPRDTRAAAGASPRSRAAAPRRRS